MCVIYWKSLYTGFIGHGDAMTCALANAWLKISYINGFEHWIEKI